MFINHKSFSPTIILEAGSTFIIPKSSDEVNKANCLTQSFTANVKAEI